jgi:glycosyltransferase involved in cell wall biosynthesis
MVSTLHSVNDVRIYRKESLCLADAGYDVNLVGRASIGNFELDTRIQLHLLDEHVLGGLYARWKRCLQTVVYVTELKPKIVHFHDPEFLPFALWLSWNKYLVIYDAHEDVALDILSKRRIPKWFRPTVALAFQLMQRLCIPSFYAVIAATEQIENSFSRHSKRAIVLRNFANIKACKHKKNLKNFTACYVGRISLDRGLIEMIQACHASEIPLVLVGRVDSELNSIISNLPDGVKWLGVLDQLAIKDVLKQSSVGLCTLYPEPNYQNALPIKLFEYMEAGLPVICSALPSMLKIVNEHKNGLLLDEITAEALAKALRILRDDADLSIQMGKRGRLAVESFYNWDVEKQKLLKLYADLSSL